MRLTRSVKESLTRVTAGGAPAYVWPGGGITIMVDALAMPDNAFGYVPTPAIVGPIEFTMPHDTYGELGGHMDFVQPLEKVLKEGAAEGRIQMTELKPDTPWPLEPGRGRSGSGGASR